jgi:hypothetical protein
MRKRFGIIVSVVFVLSIILMSMSHVTASTDSLFLAESVATEAISLDIVDPNALNATTTNEFDVARLDNESLSLSGTTNPTLGGTEISTVEFGEGSSLPVLQPQSSGRLSRTSTAASNDNPGNPIGLALGNYYTQDIDTVSDSRWFATITTAATTKLTTVLAMASNVDFDLYIYKLNGSSLNLVAYSELAGNGVQEVSNYMGSPGTYYFRVVAYSGTGNFAIYNFGTAAFDAYEMNDSNAAASAVVLTSTTQDVSIVGNIDNPLDKDHFLLTFPAETMAVDLIYPNDFYDMPAYSVSIGEVPGYYAPFN